jgi:hypothetical protein
MDSSDFLEISDVLITPPPTFYVGNIDISESDELATIRM